MYSFGFVSLKNKIMKRAGILTVVWEACLPQFLIWADEDIYYVYSAGFFSREAITLVL